MTKISVRKYVLRLRPKQKKILGNSMQKEARRLALCTLFNICSSSQIIIILIILMTTQDMANIIDQFLFLGDMFPDIIAGREIETLSVRCPKGCSSNMQLKEVQHHCSSSCQFRWESNQMRNSKDCTEFIQYYFKLDCRSDGNQNESLSNLIPKEFLI